MQTAEANGQSVVLLARRQDVFHDHRFKLILPAA